MLGKGKGPKVPAASKEGAGYRHSRRETGVITRVTSVRKGTEP